MSNNSRTGREAQAELRRLDRRRGAAQKLEALGAIPQRAAVGHRPRGLFGRWRQLAGVPVRACPQPGLPLGRGRARSASPTASADCVLRLALWNGKDPHSQGATLRADQSRGQPLRGRQGSLLLPRRHAHPLATSRPSTSTRRPSSLIKACADENRRRGRREPEYELTDTGVFDGDRYWDVMAEYAKATSRRHPDRLDSRQPRPGDGPAAPAADLVVPQHLVVGCRLRRGPVAQAAAGAR